MKTSPVSRFIPRERQTHVAVVPEFLEIAARPVALRPHGRLQAKVPNARATTRQWQEPFGVSGCNSLAGVHHPLVGTRAVDKRSDVVAVAAQAIVRGNSMPNTPFAAPAGSSNGSPRNLASTIKLSFRDQATLLPLRPR